MEATIISSLSSPPHSSPFRPRSATPRLPRKPLTVRFFASRNAEFYNSDHDDNSQLVDESMIVLRRRIHEMEMAERGYQPPAGWMGWEKQYYAAYDGHVCQLVGLLQAFLMNTRPSVAIAMLGLLMVSVPVSAIAIIGHLIDVSLLFRSG